MFQPIIADIGRRGLIKGAAGAAMLGAGAMIAPRSAQAQTSGDIDLLNLVLNIEYLLTQFEGVAVGLTLDPNRFTAGTVPGVLTPGGRRVTFSDKMLEQTVREMANDNYGALNPSRVVVGALAVGQPLMDIAVGSAAAFTVAMQRAGVVSVGATFDPYVSEENFLYAMFLLKGISVAALRGWTSLINNRVTVQNFAGFLVSCPLLSGPSTMTVWTKEGTTNAFEEAQARGDHRQAA